MSEAKHDSRAVWQTSPSDGAAVRAASPEPGCLPPDGRESRDSGGAPWVRLPTSWERVVPSARPTPVTSCPPYSCRGRSRIRDCLVSSNSAAAKARWLSVLGQGGVWTHSSATNRRESRGQPKDRNSQGGPYAAGPDVRRSRGSLPSLGLPSGLRTVATIHAVREVDCLDASSLRPCSSNAAHTRAGKGRFDARPGNCKSVPVRGSDGPDQPAVVSATATRRHVPPRSRSELRAGVPSAGDGRPGRRQLVEPCAPPFTVAPLDLTYPRRCSESRQVERPRTRQWSSRGSAGAPVRTVLR